MNLRFANISNRHRCGTLSGSGMYCYTMGKDYIRWSRSGSLGAGRSGSKTSCYDSENRIDDNVICSETNYGFSFSRFSRKFR